MSSSLPLVDRALAIFVVAAVMTGISVVAVVLRSFVRLYVVRAFGWDDALMVLALVLWCWTNLMNEKANSFPVTFRILGHLLYGWLRERSRS
jgi:hypothetical protein